MSQTYDNLQFEALDGVAFITIDRPRVLNALDGKTIDELSDVFDQVGNDPSVRVAVLSGSGERAFAAGADIEELHTLSPRQGREVALRGQAALERIENLGKPVIAAIRGYALGGGCELAMACTLRYASDDAVFGQPEVRLGLIPGYGGTQRLPRLVGRGRALELLMTGRTLPAPEALRIGLVDRVVPAADLMAEAQSTADQIKANAPLALRYCMEAVNRGSGVSLADGLELEAELFAKCFSTADMKEGTQAFLEKRAASFRGE